MKKRDEMLLMPAVTRPSMCFSHHRGALQAPPAGGGGGCTCVCAAIENQRVMDKAVVAVFFDFELEHAATK